MRPEMFDRIAQSFAERRTSRRTAMGIAASAGAALGLSVAGTPARAQEQATPEATPTASSESAENVMFVQGFGSGSLTSKDGSEDEFSLSLEQGLGYTVYFTDRPDRQFGAVPTDAFVNGFSFAEEDPPNAALVMVNAQGEETIAVLELKAPEVDTETRSMAYDVTVLREFEEFGNALQSEPVDPQHIEGDFDSAHLFIDSCADQVIGCCTKTDCNTIYGCICQGYVGTFGSVDFCWHFGDVCCHPCEHHDQSYWDDRCNETFEACEGNQCIAYGSQCW